MAIESLPYRERLRPYAGSGTTVHGDIRSVGMAEASTGLADSISSSFENPAGLAMTFGGVAAQISGDSASDQSIQSSENEIHTGHIAATASEYPWGFGIGKRTLYREGQPYLLPTGTSAILNVEQQEYRFSAARVLGSRFALGLGIVVSKGTRSLEVIGPTTYLREQESSSLGLTVGALYRLPAKLLLGASFTTGTRMKGEPNQSPAFFPGFFQDIESAPRGAFGIGWLPNRFTRVGASLNLLSSTPNTSLLSDQSVRSGYRATAQPRFGIAYNIVDIRDFKIYIASGTYFEASKIENFTSRWHWTSSLEIEPWILNLGWGIDRSVGFQNQIFSLGMDFVRLGRKLKVIPPSKGPDPGGLLPNPFRISEAGLPLAMSDQPHRRTDETPEEVIDIAKELPSRVKERFRDPVVPVQELGKDMIDTLKNVTDEVKKELSGSEKKAN